MSETTTNASKSWTISTPDIIEIFEPEYEEAVGYQEASELVRKLKKRVHELKKENARLKGEAETWEKMWRIWNE